MTSGTPLRRRTGWLTLAAAAAMATLLSCSDKPTIEPTAPVGLRSISPGPMVGRPSSLPSARLKPLGRTITASVASTFTADPSAAEFVVTGAEGSVTEPTEHYIPSNGNGTFGAKSNIPGLGTVDGLDVADIDGDGDNDFLVCDATANEVYLYTNNGGGSFSPSVAADCSPSSSFSTYLREGDFNGDGRKDFVVGDLVAAGGMFVYLQTSSGTFTKQTAGLDVSAYGSVYGVAAGDVDSDGDVDILVLGLYDAAEGQVRLYKGDGTGAMGAPTLVVDVKSDFGAGGTSGLALFDVDSDGDLDIVAGGGNVAPAGVAVSGHYVYTNDGSANFAKPAVSAFNLQSQTGVDAYDADADGDHDLMVADFEAGKLYYVQNQRGILLPPVLVSDLNGASAGVGAPSIRQSAVIQTTEEVGAGQAATVEVEEECTSEADRTCDVAGVDIPAGTTNQIVIVTVRLEELPEGEFCHDYLMAQYGRCLLIDIKNKIGGGDATLLKPIVAGLCLPSHLELEIYKFEERDQPPRPLGQVDAAFLECEGFKTSSAKPSNWFEGLALGLSKRVGKWITPKSAYAADQGFGGYVDDGHTSFFTWASPIQVTDAGLAINAFRSGDVFGVSGIFGLEAKGFDPDDTDAGFDGLTDAVTVQFGEASQTILPGSFRFMKRTGRWTYTSGAGVINYMDIDPSTGEFRVAGRIPTEGGTLPTDKPFTVRLGNRIRGGRLFCGTNGGCALHH